MRLIGRALRRLLRERLRRLQSTWPWPRPVRRPAALDLAACRWEVAGATLDYRATLEQLLLHNVLPFWYPLSIDSGHGGYRLNHDIEGRWRGPAPKHIVSQARTTWFFATLAGTRYGAREHLNASAHGCRFLLGRCWDAQHGGFYWEVSADGGDTLQDRKHLYGQAFGLYALSAYAMAASDGVALGRAADLFALLERHAHDAACGGYHEDLLRDWRPRTGQERGPLGTLPGQKTLNTHLHLLEALTEYLRASGDALARTRLEELVSLLAAAVLRRVSGACGDLYERDWSPVNNDRNRRISYGHDLELLWLAREAWAQLELPVAGLAGLDQALFEPAWRYGYDRRHGGFFHQGPYGGAADRHEKIWWVQAEALTATLDRYTATGAPEAAECFRGTLDWIVRHQADWTRGEWYARLDGPGRPSGDKAGAHWKGPYHNGRALLRCLTRLHQEPLELPGPPRDAASGL